MGHIPEDLALFKQYAKNKNNFVGVRQCAFEILIEFLSLRADEELIDFLFNTIENDHSYTIKHHIVMYMACQTPLKYNFDDSSESSKKLVNKLWCLIFKFKLNYRLKTGLTKLYQSLYGFGKPKCLKQVMIPFNEAIEAVNLF